jgi:FRG domain
MPVPFIEVPANDIGPAKKLTEFLNISGQWHESHDSEGSGALSQLWYRGVNQNHGNLLPGIYRDDFTERAKALPDKKSLEEKRLRLERETVSQFRTGGARFLGSHTLTEIYFIAQHYGLPTRLLDWSTNPFAALFFACDGNDGKDGFVYAMDARQVLPPNNELTDSRKLYQAVMTMRHPHVTYAVEVSFWGEVKKDHRPYVLPVRPDHIPGRIGQQSSCFTLHMHNAGSIKNSTLNAIKIDANSKETLRRELRKVNINQFTVYNDLDHLSREIVKGWAIRK